MRVFTGSLLLIYTSSRTFSLLFIIKMYCQNIADEDQPKESRGSVNNIHAALSAAAEPSEETQKCLEEPKVKTKAGWILHS